MPENFSLTPPNTLLLQLALDAFNEHTLQHPEIEAPLKTLAEIGDNFLLLLENTQEQHLHGNMIKSIEPFIRVWQAQGLCFSALPCLQNSLFLACMAWTKASAGHIYLNLDLLTIDPHAQDWGDFKIKPEQVEIQRSELTVKALFSARSGWLLQVKKTQLKALEDTIRATGLIQQATVIGKAWGSAEVVDGLLEVYRDAKLQLSLSPKMLNRVS